MKTGQALALECTGVQLTQLMLATFQLHGQLVAAGDRLTKPLGLSSALWKVLGAIDNESQPMSHIARKMGLTRQGVRRSVNALKHKGFIELQENPNSKRAPLVVLTPEGRNVLDQITQRHTQWVNRIAKEFQTTELESATQTIKSLINRL